MKKIAKKILAVVIVISLLICSSLAVSANAYHSDFSGIEFRGGTYYGTPGEEICFDYVGPDEYYEYVNAISMDESVVECYYDDETGLVTSIEAVDNGVALLNIYFMDEDYDIVDDYYALVVVSDGRDLGEVSYIDMEDVKINYNEENYLGPMIFYESEEVYYCTFYDYDFETAPFWLSNDGYCYGAERGSAAVTCYVVDAQGNVFSDTCKVEVKFNFIQWIIYYLFFGWIWM